MSPPSLPLKRVRSERCEDGVPQASAASVAGDPPTTQRPGPAARKRELERQRRNLVSTRFSELDRVLLYDPDGGRHRGRTQLPKRIDKEAILKDAATRISSQSAELVSLRQRLAAMSEEVASLRAEKVELRADKAYLHTELGTVRSEAQRLRADNIHLWQAIRKSGGLKNALSVDVAKIPADLLLRAQQSNAAANNPPSSNPATEKDASGQKRRRGGDGNALDGRPPLPSPPPALGGEQEECFGKCDKRSCASCRIASSARHGVDDHALGTSLVDSFLVFQSPEELGELFSDCVEPAAPHPPDFQAPCQPAVPNLRPNASDAFSSGDLLGPHPTHDSLPTSRQQAADGKEDEAPFGTAALVHSAHGPTLGGVPGREANTGGGEREGAFAENNDEFIADVAYCA